MNGKLFWNKLKVIQIEWNDIHLSTGGTSHGLIDIHIPCQLDIPYNPMDETPWLIRTAIHKQLQKLGWPPKDIENLYFFYHETFYHLQIMTSDKATADFYNHLLQSQATAT